MASEESTTPTVMPSVMTMNFDTVTLKIGQAEITIHKDLLTTTSNYFCRASVEPVRDNERSITPEGVSERALKMFLQWAYAQSLQFDTSSAALGFDAVLLSAVAKGIEREATTSAEVADVTGEAEGEPAANTDSKTSRSPLFDEKRYHLVSTGQQLYRDNEKWMGNADEFYLGLTELYILADKYSVPQLRDDVVTAFIGQCWKWYWFPSEDDKALILLMTNNLPVSSKLRKFLACSIAWIAIPHPESDPNTMRSLRKLDPDLAHEIGVIYAIAIHGADEEEVYQISTDPSEHLPNAYMFHDHTHVDQDQCRKRIASRPHIFTAVLDACAKAVMTNPIKEE